MKKCLVEFIGTFFLVFTIGMAVRHGTPLAPFAIGAILMVMIYAGGHVSGAHFNPAVTLAVLVRGRADDKGLPYVGYWLAQLAGALIAACLVNYLQSGLMPGGPALHPTIPSIIVEFLFTFALAWVILNTAMHRGTAGNSFYGVAIGMTVLAGAITVGGISGGAFNPAVGLAALVMGLESAKQLGVHIVSDLAGAVTAAFVFKLVHGSD
jgi:aquaporin Z